MSYKQDSLYRLIRQACESYIIRVMMILNLRQISREIKKLQKERKEDSRKFLKFIPRRVVPSPQLVKLQGQKMALSQSLEARTYLKLTIAEMREYAKKDKS